MPSNELAISSGILNWPMKLGTVRIVFEAESLFRSLR